MTSLYDLIVEAGSGGIAKKHFLEDARSERVVTYGDMLYTMRAWQAYFHAHGFENHYSVVVDVSDPLTFGLTHLSVLALGLCSIPVNPEGPNHEIERIVGEANTVRWVISDRETDRGTIGTVWVVSPRVIEELLPTESAKRGGSGSVILYTSGSTGVPKGVLMSERQLMFVAGQVAMHHRLVETDRGYNSLPLFHINAEVVGLLATLTARSTLILDRRFHKQDFWELMHERQVTWINAVPAIMAILARETSLDLPPTLRFIRSASAMLPDILTESFNKTRVVISWGMTEAASQITATPLDQPLRRGSVGVPVGSEVQARGDTGIVLSAGESGMLWIRGEGIVKSYLAGRAADSFDTDGWLRTGDIGRIDTDGYVYLLGRSDDVINRGGEKLYPIEIENVVLQDDMVREVIVVSGDDDVLGHVPIAYVISTDENMTDKRAVIMQHRLRVLCDQELPRFKRPSKIFIMRDLPRAPTGKVKRAQLRQMASDKTLFGRFEALAS